MSDHPLDAVLQRLQQVRVAGDGFTALCPAHEDREPSLSIAEGADGRVLLHCHAGCEVEAVLHALRLTFADLYPAAPGTATPLSLDALSRLKGIPTGYLIARGLRRVGRDVRIPYRHRDGSEARPQFRRPNGKHYWDKGSLKPIIPYGLDRLGEARKVYLCEGCSDSWTLDLHGFPTLSLPGTDMTKKIEADHLDGLGRLIVVQEDDAGGRKFVRGVADRLRTLGFCGEVHVIDMAQAGANDPNDLYQRNRAGFAEAWRRLTAEARPLNLTVFEIGSVSDAAEGFETLSMRELLTREFAATEYVVEKMLPVGGLSLLVAKPKAGKSTLARQLALAIARGDDFLGRSCRKGPVLYVALEESLASVQAHFCRLGATGDEPIYVTTGRTPEDAVRALTNTAKRFLPALIVVDPVVLLTRIKDASAYAEVYRALEPVIGLARETNAHVLLLHHSAKVERGGIDSPLGSTAFGGGVDTILHLKRREDGARILSSVQRNGEDLAETVLMMDEVTGEVAPAGSYADLRLRETVDAMSEVLESAEELLTRDELFEKVEAAATLKNDALRVLREDDLLDVGGTGKRGDPKRYALRKGRSAAPDAEPGESASSAPERLFSCSEPVVRTGKQESDPPIVLGGDGFVGERPLPALGALDLGAELDGVDPDGGDL